MKTTSLQMKRLRIDPEAIATWDNLQLAVWKAVKGKRLRPTVIQFFEIFDTALTQLQSDILAEKVPYGIYRSFIIHDPKRRLIHAASFADRVLHHAILNLAEPVFEQSLVDWTFACRSGKGVHLAVKQVQRNLQRFPWFVQVDVEHYFASIDHQRMMHLLTNRFKGTACLRLFGRILETYHTSPGKGLPIGSLTSQHFANLYLDAADRFLQNHPSVHAQIRYMDDIVWWCEDKLSAQQVLNAFQHFLEDDCLLRLKSTIRMNRSTVGMHYCGFRILPGVIRLPLRKKRRYRFLIDQYESAWLADKIDSKQLQMAFASVVTATFPAQSRCWRQIDLQLHPSLYDNVSG